MAGHSKWANIRHRKGAQDTKRSKLFSKMIKEISVAVKSGRGGPPEGNLRLRTAIQNARGQNIPKDTIDKAIKKAMGRENKDLEEITFEGHGPGGTTFFIECATDNKTRTVGNIRSYFNKFGGNLGKNGCLDFLYSQKGIFIIPLGQIEIESFMMDMIDAGAEDVELDKDVIVIVTERENHSEIQKRLEDLGIGPKEMGLQRIPHSMATPQQGDLEKANKLLEALEDDEDVQQVFHNLE